MLSSSQPTPHQSTHLPGVRLANICELRRVVEVPDPVPGGPGTHAKLPVCYDATHAFGGGSFIPAAQLMVNRGPQGKRRGIHLMGKQEVQVPVGVVEGAGCKGERILCIHDKSNSACPGCSWQAAQHSTVKVKRHSLNTR
jgi:hypothetical protein